MYLLFLEDFDCDSLCVYGRKRHVGALLRRYHSVKLNLIALRFLTPSLALIEVNRQRRVLYGSIIVRAGKMLVHRRFEEAIVG